MNSSSTSAGNSDGSVTAKCQGHEKPSSIKNPSSASNIILKQFSIRLKLLTESEISDYISSLKKKGSKKRKFSGGHDNIRNKRPRLPLITSGKISAKDNILSRVANVSSPKSNIVNIKDLIRSRGVQYRPPNPDCNMISQIFQNPSGEDQRIVRVVAEMNASIQNVVICKPCSSAESMRSNHDRIEIIPKKKSESVLQNDTINPKIESGKKSSGHSTEKIVKKPFQNTNIFDPQNQQTHHNGKADKVERRLPSRDICDQNVGTSDTDMSSPSHSVVEASNLYNSADDDSLHTRQTCRTQENYNSSKQMETEHRKRRDSHSDLNCSIESVIRDSDGNKRPKCVISSDEKYDFLKDYINDLRDKVVSNVEGLAHQSKLDSTDPQEKSVCANIMRLSPTKNNDHNGSKRTDVLLLIGQNGCDSSVAPQATLLGKASNDVAEDLDGNQSNRQTDFEKEPNSNIFIEPNPGLCDYSKKSVKNHITDEISSSSLVKDKVWCNEDPENVLEISNERTIIPNDSELTDIIVDIIKSIIDEVESDSRQLPERSPEFSNERTITSSDLEFTNPIADIIELLINEVQIEFVTDKVDSADIVDPKQLLELSNQSPVNFAFNKFETEVVIDELGFTDVDPGHLPEHELPDLESTNSSSSIGTISKELINTQEEISEKLDEILDIVSKLNLCIPLHCSSPHENTQVFTSCTENINLCNFQEVSSIYDKEVQKTINRMKLVLELSQKNEGSGSVLSDELNSSSVTEFDQSTENVFMLVDQAQNSSSLDHLCKNISEADIARVRQFLTKESQEQTEHLGANENFFSDSSKIGCDNVFLSPHKQTETAKKLILIRCTTKSLDSACIAKKTKETIEKIICALEIQENLKVLNLKVLESLPESFKKFQFVEQLNIGLGFDSSKDINTLPSDSNQGSDKITDLNRTEQKQDLTQMSEPRCNDIKQSHHGKLSRTKHSKKLLKDVLLCMCDVVFLVETFADAKCIDVNIVKNVELFRKMHQGNINDMHKYSIKDEGHKKNIEDGHRKNIEDGHRKNIEDGHRKNIEDVHNKSIEDVHKIEDSNLNQKGKGDFDMSQKGKKDFDMHQKNIKLGCHNKKVYPKNTLAITNNKNSLKEVEMELLHVVNGINNMELNNSSKNGITTPHELNEEPNKELRNAIKKSLENNKKSKHIQGSGEKSKTKSMNNFLKHKNVPNGFSLSNGTSEKINNGTCAPYEKRYDNISDDDTANVTDEYS